MLGCQSMPPLFPTASLSVVLSFLNSFKLQALLKQRPISCNNMCALMSGQAKRIISIRHCANSCCSRGTPVQACCVSVFVLHGSTQQPGARSHILAVCIVCAAATAFCSVWWHIERAVILICCCTLHASGVSLVAFSTVGCQQHPLPSVALISGMCYVQRTHHRDTLLSTHTIVTLCSAHAHHNACRCSVL